MHSSVSMPLASTARTDEEEPDEECFDDHLRTKSAGPSKDRCEDHPDSEHRGTPAERSDCQPKGYLTPEEEADKRSTKQSTDILDTNLEGRNDQCSEEDGAVANRLHQRGGHEEKLSPVNPSVKEGNPFSNHDHVPDSTCTEAAVPWWAGAFGAVPDMDDGCEQRGFYTRQFCQLFFPDNTDEATEVRRYCSLLE